MADKQAQKDPSLAFAAAPAVAPASTPEVEKNINANTLARYRLALKQLDLAGLGNTGNRFIVDLENGKPTVQLQKVLDLMDLLGLEVVVRTKASRSTSSL